MSDIKERARAAVRRALDRGRLVRPSECSNCGSAPPPSKDGRATIHAHHHMGYGRPLDVEWLCPKCHFNHDPRPSGKANGRAVLTPEAVADIRSAPGRTKELAARYGVHRTTIQHARRGTYWIDAALNDGADK